MQVQINVNEAQKIEALRGIAQNFNGVCLEAGNTVILDAVCHQPAVLLGAVHEVCGPKLVVWKK